jgi:hypothetical protein
MYSGRFFVALCLLLGLIAISRGDDRTFRAGAAATDITPLKLPVSMTGSFTDRKATDVHDRLSARSLVLDDGQTRVAITVVDSALIPSEIFDAAKAAASRTTGIPANRMMISATHTHTAPTAYEMAQCKPDPDYLRHLARQIAASIEAAHARLEPARIGWGTIDLPSQVFNRRWRLKPGTIPPDPFGNTTDQVKTNPGVLNPDLVEPAGPTDPEISFVAVQSPTGEPKALLASYSLHYVGGIPANQLSADYFGEFARQLAERYGSNSFVGILANGTSGDVNNIDVRQPAKRAPSFEKIREVAAEVSDKVYTAAQNIAFHDHVPLVMVERDVMMSVRRPNSEQLARAHELLRDTPAEQSSTLPAIYAQEAIALSQFPEQVPVKLQALRIGSLAIVAEPCEAFAEIGLELKRRSPFKPTFAIGLANGYRGYLPTPAQHALGGYETWPSRWSYLQRDASEKMIEALLEMLDQIKP